MTALTTVLLGDVVPARRVPVARIAADPVYGVIGSVVRLDARASSDPDNLPLTYSWSFDSAPIGSVVRLEGFRTLDSDGGLVSFSPDKVGTYVVRLVANNGVFDSSPETSSINIRVSLVPDATGIVPDGKWLWSYIRDVWAGVDGKEMFETLWSALIQIVGADLLKLYETDYNKSIRDIQELFQRRWLSYQPELTLEDADISFYLGNQAAGTDAAVGSYSFSVPTASSKKLTDLLKGRIVTVGGSSSKIVRTSATSDGGVDTITAVLESTLPAGPSGQAWRVPITVSSETLDFDSLGASPGDVLWVDVVLEGTNLVANIKTQVVGVYGNSLGVVITDEAVVAGKVPAVPASYYRSLAASLGIGGLGKAPDGGVLFAGDALLLNTVIKSEIFKRNYHNRKLTPYDSISVGKWSFRLHPRRLIRNRRIPVDSALRSIPGLQEYIVQPTVVEKNGKIYQVANDKEFELQSKPVALTENTDYLVDSDYAFNGSLVFRTGSDIIEGEEADFVDRSVSPGDTFIVDSPVLSTTESNEYTIQAVLGPNTLRLDRATPTYTLGEWAIAKVRIRRRIGGTYLRFVPGRFTAKNPAPSRLWAESSFFDNASNIENNFGVLVGLTKEQMDSISANASYRQAVAGLMYAYTQGSAINKVLLGAQILLGLPFTEKRGLILSIEGDYRLNSIGEPSLGRIVVEDLNDDGSRTNLVRIYTYPIDVASDLAGVAINPATNKEYVVGDTVEKFRPLSKGVEITDYLMTEETDSTTALAALQKYHLIQARFNDTVFNSAELQLVSSFLNKITPSYIRVAIRSLAQFVDELDIVDTIRFNKTYYLTDGVFSGFAVAPSFDSVSVNNVPQVFFDSSVYEVRKYGKDLETVALVGAHGSSQPFSSSDDLTDPEPPDEVWEGARCIAGDVLYIIDGLNSGKYTIDSISGTSGTVSDAPEYGFYPATNQTFAILRKCQPVILTSDVEFQSESDSVLVADSLLRSFGVRPGDWLIVNSGNRRRYLIKTVEESAPGMWDTLTVSPTPDRSDLAAGAIVRPGAMSSLSRETYSITSNGTSITSTDWLLKGILDVRDQLVVDSGQSYVVTDPVLLKTSVVPPAGTYTVRIRKNSPYTWDGFDFEVNESADISLYPRAPEYIEDILGNRVTDILDVDITTVEGFPTTVGASPVVDLALPISWAMPGDFLEFVLGTNEGVDVGYGNGVYPIAAVSGTTLTLTQTPPNPGANYWKITRRR